MMPVTRLPSKYAAAQRAYRRALADVEAMAEQEYGEGWRARRVTRLLQTETASPCSWSVNGDGIWETACGHAFEFTNGGPRENQAQYCCYCGAEIQATKRR